MAQGTPPVPILPDDTSASLPAWWPWAAGGLAAITALALGAMLRRRRKPKVLRLAPAAPSADKPVAALPNLDLTLEVTGATRSVMMFSLAYRLTLANRTDRAASDLSIAMQLACAQRGASNAASAGAAQQFQHIERIGPHQSRSVLGTVQIPLAAIAPLRQGNLPLFIPLVHVTLAGEGTSALSRTFVIGTPSAVGNGRLHPIVLDSPPGSIFGLQAQRIQVPPISAAA